MKRPNLNCERVFLNSGFLNFFQDELTAENFPTLRKTAETFVILLCDRQDDKCSSWHNVVEQIALSKQDEWDAAYSWLDT